MDIFGTTHGSIQHMVRVEPGGSMSSLRPPLGSLVRTGSFFIHGGRQRKEGAPGRPACQSAGRFHSDRRVWGLVDIFRPEIGPSERLGRGLVDISTWLPGSRRADLFQVVELGSKSLNSTIRNENQKPGFRSLQVGEEARYPFAVLQVRSAETITEFRLFDEHQKVYRCDHHRTTST